MGKALLVLYNDAMRARAIDWIRRARPETRVTFQGPKRSLDQNAKLWAMLQEVADQKEHFGRKYHATTWKAVMMQAWGREVNFIPTLDGSGVMPIMYSSSDLTKSECAELIEFILSWGTQNGVLFHDAETRETNSDMQNRGLPPAG